MITVILESKPEDLAGRSVLLYSGREARISRAQMVLTSREEAGSSIRIAQTVVRVPAKSLFSRTAGPKSRGRLWLCWSVKYYKVGAPTGAPSRRNGPCSRPATAISIIYALIPSTRSIFRINPQHVL